MKENKLLGLNIDEIRLEDEFRDMDFLTNYLFDCSCIIFLVDISDNYSFLLAKKYISYITNIYEKNLKYCKILLVLNKIDLKEENKKIDIQEINNFIDDLSGKNNNNKDNIDNNNNFIEKIEISAKNNINLENLWNKVYISVNEKSNPHISINKMQERLSNYNEKKISELIKSDGIINIVLMGDSGVGKSNLFYRYFNLRIEENFVSTIGIERQTKIIKYKNLIYNINISDTAGQERFRSLPLRYFKNAEGILLLFDVNSEKSFKNIEQWVDDMKNNDKNLKQKVYIIGNKIDIKERKVSYKEGEEMAKNLGFKYFEMSCKINMNVFEVLSRLIEECIKDLNPDNINNNNGKKLSQKYIAGNKNSCC